MKDEFRVEVELDDDEHGHSTGERLRALDLDDDARERLGSMVMVTRDGSKLFLYTAAQAHATDGRAVESPCAMERPGATHELEGPGDQPDAILACDAPEEVRQSCKPGNGPEQKPHQPEQQYE